MEFDELGIRKSIKSYFESLGINGLRHETDSKFISSINRFSEDLATHLWIEREKALNINYDLDGLPAFETKDIQNNVKTDITRKNGTAKIGPGSDKGPETGREESTVKPPFSEASRQSLPPLEPVEKPYFCDKPEGYLWRDDSPVMVVHGWTLCGFVSETDPPKFYDRCRKGGQEAWLIWGTEPGEKMEGCDYPNARPEDFITGQG